MAGPVNLANSNLVDCDKGFPNVVYIDDGSQRENVELVKRELEKQASAGLINYTCIQVGDVEKNKGALDGADFILSTGGTESGISYLQNPQNRYMKDKAIIDLDQALGSNGSFFVFGTEGSKIIVTEPSELSTMVAPTIFSMDGITGHKGDSPTAKEAAERELAKVLAKRGWAGSGFFFNKLIDFIGQISISCTYVDKKTTETTETKSETTTTNAGTKLEKRKKETKKT